VLRLVARATTITMEMPIALATLKGPLPKLSGTISHHAPNIHPILSVAVVNTCNVLLISQSKLIIPLPQYFTEADIHIHCPLYKGI
jgi:hypothetical protein